MPTKKETANPAANGSVTKRPKRTRITAIEHSEFETNGSNGSGGHAHTDGGSLLDDQELLRVLTEVKNGNFAVRMPINQLGLTGKICDTLNDIISMNEKMMLEFTRAGNTIGKQGKLTQRIEVP